MSRTFDATSTTDDVLEGVDLKGKRFLVTGVSAGIGVETARALAAHGGYVVGAARNLSKAEVATAQVREDAARGGGGFELLQLDLASLASVRAAADALLAAGHPFDVVITNAGVMMTPQGRTVDGFETQFGTNHLGHFLLVNRIASLIKPGGRVVILSSGAHRAGDVDLTDPNFDRIPYEPFLAYGRSKTANILFAVEFDRRHRARGIRAAAVHPGVIQTELGRHIPSATLATMLTGVQTKTVPQGAATSVWAGAVAPADDIGGRYCQNCRVGPVVPLDVPLRAGEEGVRPYALDAESAKALWDKSEEWVGQKF